MRKEGFNIQKTKDPIFTYLPNGSGYVLLTEDIYDKIMKGKYRY